MTVPSPTEPIAALAKGTLVSDRYRIDSLLGEGGMGAVYSAEHVHMRKQVAVKVLHPEMCETPEVVARFEREAIAAAHIEHPNVAAATDFGRLPNGACFLVLEYLRGHSLRSEVGRGALAPERALRILRGIAEGVSAAHTKGIVHRDLKPENVMLVDRDGDPDFVKVLDFGIAKLDAAASAAPAGQALTRAGTIFGTPEYMAPEQAVGDVVDARADLYAIGVILVEMVTGKCPFSGTALSIIRERVLNPEPVDFASIAHPGVRSILKRLLVREPQARMQTAIELVAAIDEVIGGRWSMPASMPASMRASVPAISIVSPNPEGFTAAAATAPTSLQIVVPQAPSRRRWVVAAAIGAAALVVGFGSVIAYSSASRAETAASASASTPSAPSPSSVPEPKIEPTPEPKPEAKTASSPVAEPPPARPAAAAPEPTTSAASARATPKHKTSPRPARSSAPPPRKTGPGGIYIPPPKDWF